MRFWNTRQSCRGSWAWMRVKNEAQAPGRRGAAEKCPCKCFPWYKQRRDVPGTGSNLCPSSFQMPRVSCRDTYKPWGEGGGREERRR